MKLIEVVLLWGRDVVELRHLDDECTRLTVGMSADDDLFIPTASVELLARTQHGWILRSLETGAMTLVNDDVDVRYTVGAFTVRVHVVDRAHRLALAPVFDALWANVATLTMFATAALVAAAVLMPTSIEPTVPTIATEQFMALMLRPPLPPAPKAPAASEPTRTTRTTTTMTMMSRKRARTPPMTDEQIVAAKLATLFGDGASALVKTGASADAFAAALDGVAGREVAVAGLALKGAPSSSSTGTFGLGRLGTRGRGDGDVAYGSSEGSLGGRDDRDVTVTDAPPVVVGSLDKEIIRRVVRDHMSQVRACYERELQSDAGLAGKVTLRWSIAPTGNVAQASGEPSTGALAGVGDCIARAARSWRFPAPRGGGTVVVAYPFVFKST